MGKSNFVPLLLLCIVQFAAGEPFPPHEPLAPGMPFVAHPAETAQAIGGCSMCSEGKICRLAEASICPQTSDSPPCPLGFFCPWGTEEPMQCPSGFVCDSEGQNAAAPCPAGFFCPMSSSGLYDSRVDCPNGHFCRNNTEVPLKCTWGAFCGVRETAPKRSRVLGPLAVAVCILMWLLTHAYGRFQTRRHHERMRKFEAGLQEVNDEAKALERFTRRLNRQRRNTVSVLHALQSNLRNFSARMATRRSTVARKSVGVAITQSDRAPPEEQATANLMASPDGPFAAETSGLRLPPELKPTEVVEPADTLGGSAPTEIAGEREDAASAHARKEEGAGRVHQTALSSGFVFESGAAESRREGAGAFGDKSGDGHEERGGIMRTESLRQRTLHKLNQFLQLPCGCGGEGEDGASAGHQDTFRFTGLTYKKNQVHLGFRDVCLRVPERTPLAERMPWVGRGRRWQQVLRGVSGEVRAAKLTAIMGPSGSGKSSLLNVLAGRAQYGETGGTVAVNGAGESLESYAASVGFVPQDDVMLEELTVLENLYYTAELRLPAAPRAHLDAVVHDVLRVLDLQHVAHTPVGCVLSRGISGGERKRVNIGLELVADPTLLFLDEPTSGLDSATSLKVLRALKRLCKIGATVATVIHQPRSLIFEMFDDLILLRAGGEVAYAGPASLAVAYFKGLGFDFPSWENPADWLIDVISGDCAPCVPDPACLPQALPLPDPADLVLLWASAGAASVAELEKAAAGEAAAAAAAGSEGGLNEEERGELEAVFRKCDREGRGELDKAALAEVIVRYLGAESIAHWFEGVFSRHQRSAAGISLPEFLAAMSDILHGEALDHGVQAQPREYARSRRAHRLALPELSRAQRSSVGVFAACLGRDIRQKWRKADLLAKDLALVCAGAVLLGLLTGSDNSSAQRLNAAVQSHTLMGLLGNIFALRAFGTQREVRWREVAAGLHVTAYVCAKMLGQLLQNILLTSFFVLMYHQMVAPLVDVGRLLLVFWSLTFAMTPFGMVASIVNKPSTAMTAAVLFPMITVTSLSGLTPSFAEIPGMLLMLAGLISPGRWSVEANTIFEWKIEAASSGFAHARIEAMIDNRQFKHDADWSNLGRLVLMGSAWRVICWVLIRYEVWHKTRAR